MNWIIGMPNLGHTMEEGKVSEWLKRVGDPVSKGEVIAVVESDKASFDVESPADGFLVALEVEAGLMAPVGATIGVVGAAIGPAVAFAPPAGRPKLTPAARALAQELGIDPAGIVPSGDDGLINRDDVRAHAAARKGGLVDVSQPGSAESVGASGGEGFSPMRRAIAAATQQAWQAIPHVALQSHANVDSLVQRRAPLTAAIARATAKALQQHPAFNGQLVGNGFAACADVHLGIAVATPDGLVTAVVRNAERSSVTELNDAIGKLAADARTGRLDGARTLGATFTISSLGRWDVDAFAPIIAAPQVAILGIGRVDRVARETPAGGVRFVSEIRLTLVFDHRANDGVQAAQLLAAIVKNIESPDVMEEKA